MRDLTQEQLEARQALWRAALYAALADRDRIEKAMALGTGVWWPELAPLQAVERTAILDELRGIWQLPDSDHVYDPKAQRWVKRPGVAA